MSSLSNSKYELLLRHDVEPHVALHISRNEFANWHESDLSELLSRVRRPSASFAYFKASDKELAAWQAETAESLKELCGSDTVADQDRKHVLTTELAHLTSDRQWISPSYGLMEQSAKQKKALCINRKLEWSLRTEGYVALSHCWVEGLHPDGANRGLSLTKLERVFKLLDHGEVDVEWVWTDVLVIPGGDVANSTAKDETLKTDIINTMKLVYERADHTIVFDALLLQLYPRDKLDVAAAIMLGKWRSRIWTFQESRLASSVLLLTATAVYTLQEVTQAVIELSRRDRDKYHTISRQLEVMSKSDYVPSISDILVACAIRRATVDIDYIRGMFGVLDLQWTYGMTQEEGLELVYSSRIAEVSRILFFSGTPRLKGFPTWAPSRLFGLQGMTVDASETLRWGIKGKWWLNKIKSLAEMTTQDGETVFDFEMDSGPDTTMRCVTDGGEDTAVLDKFKTVVSRDLGYIVSSSSLAEPAAAAYNRTVLLVQKRTPLTLREDDVEVQVHIAACKVCNTLHSGAQTTMVIRHNGPITSKDIEDDRLNIVLQAKRFGFTYSYKRPPLYEAIRSGDNALVERLLDEGAPVNGDSNERQTSVTYAVQEGTEDVLKTLLARGADIEMYHSSGAKYTPLMEAAREGRLRMAKILLNHGANVKHLNEYKNNALICAASGGHEDMIQLLFENGAYVLDQDQYSASLTSVCMWAPLGKRLRCMRLLLEAGADINYLEETHGTALQICADRGNTELVKYLLDHGADATKKDQHGRDALWHSLHLRPSNSVQRTPSVDTTRLLLEAGSDRNAVYTGGPFTSPGSTPTHLAVWSKNWELLRLLLEVGDVKLNVEGRLDNGKWTPLHLAVSLKQHMMVRMLIDHGASPWLELEDGRNAIAIAVIEKDPITLQIMMKYMKDNEEESKAAFTELAMRRKLRENKKQTEDQQDAQASTSNDKQ